MPRRIYPTNTLRLRQVISPKFFFLICGIIFCVLIVSIYSTKREEKIVQEVIQNVGHDIKYINAYRKPDRLPKDFKYILLWTSSNFSPFYFLGNGQKAFIRNHCPVINCYVTSNRYFFGNDITRFDAVAFNGRNMIRLHPSKLPKKRSTRQKYIYFNLESSDNYPICSERYDGFFNWTATYKLDSDIPYPYLLIRNSSGVTIGPKRNMQWVKYHTNISEELPQKLHGKKKAVAWFVSNCKDRSGRRDFVWSLENALATHKVWPSHMSCRKKG
jgi:hypothetical protein